MRLLSQLGAHPSRLVAVSSPSTSSSPFSISRSLPFPANAPRSRAASRRSRFYLFLGTVSVTFILFFLFSDVRTTSNSDRWTWRAPSLRGKLYGYGNRDGEAPSDDPFANVLPIREDPHPNPHVPLPRDTVFTNPWPADPKIITTWLSDERLGQMGMELPEWPVAGTGARTLKKPNRLARSSMVKWKELWRQSWYKPAELEAIPDAFPSHRMQADSFRETEEDVAIRRARKDWVRRAFLHAWTGYKAKAWGHDEVKPMTGKYSNSFNAWGATIVDSLSTLLVMNLTEEYRLARTHVRQIDFTTVLGESSAYGARTDSLSVPVFETIIRYLGGLLSAYDLTDGKDLLMLERAEELAGWLFGAFDTRYGLPVGKYTISSHLEGKYAGRAVLAEVGSFSLEFGRLAQITGKQEYYDVVHRAGEFLAKHQWRMTGGGSKRPGPLMQAYVDDSTGDMEGVFSFGAQTDSYYEYLLKGGLLFRNATIGSSYLSRYSLAMDAAKDTNLISPVKVVPGKDQEDLTIFGQLQYGTYWPILEHLACFAGGMVAMGSRVLGNERASDLEIGEKFTKTCFWAYNATYTGLGPETMTFYHDKDLRRFSKHTDSQTGEKYLKVAGSPAGQQKADRKFQGRPETIESIWYLWRITGDPVWQERGWAMFIAWVKHTVAPFGFAGLNNVNNKHYRQVDKMESFVLAETLKYYYLLFSDPDYLSLDEFVLNTEAHPLRLPSESPPSSYSSSWAPSIEDDELAAEHADPNQSSAADIGQGTLVQQLLSQVMN